HAADALCRLESKTTTVFPLVATDIAVHMGGFLRASNVAAGGVKRSLEDREREEYDVGGTGFSAVFPGTILAVVDSKCEASICPDRVIASGTRHQTEVESTAHVWIELAHDIAVHVIDVLVGMEEGTKREVIMSWIDRRAGRDFDVLAPTFECACVEVYAMVNAMIAAA
ncbi:MAG TPA: hypothetical protein DGO43_07820, partial [Chloroflexi bacterium]|nr:hypothetical protein [Chloroflexota bacterium]